MTTVTAPSRKGTLPLLLLAGMAAAAWITVYIIGAAILPESPPQTAAGELPPSDRLVGSQSVLISTGDIVEQQTLDQVSITNYNEAAETAGVIDLSLTFRNSDSSLVILANGVGPDQPATGDTVEATFAIGGGTFFANSGECSVEIRALEYIVLEPMVAVRVGPPRGTPIPAYTGHITCTDVKELRSDQMVTLNAIFQYRPDLEP